MADNRSFIERLQTHLFDNKLEPTFDKDEQEMISRYRAVYTKWYAEPMTSKKSMVAFLQNDFNVSETTAYRDLLNVELLLGNVNNAAKEFHRHAANEFIREAAELIQDARENFELKKAEAMIKAANALVDINKLRTDEGEDLRWRDIKPTHLEVTDNVEEIGMKRRIPKNKLEAKKAAIRRKYFSDIDDVEFEELDNANQESLPE